ncbi:MAG: hypothetical protein WC749_13890 [Dehalococcoidia bacterium]
MMKTYLSLVALVLVLCAMLLGAAPALAADPSAIIISTNAPLPLLVGGLETEKLPVSVPAGSAGAGDRWIFQGWSNGSNSQAITLYQPGVYKAVYAHEVLLHVKSAVAVLQKSQWVPYGSPAQVVVPEIVQEGDQVRYRFQQWSDGETPFLNTNAIAPLAPVILEVKWVKEYLITVKGPAGVAVPGSGWYADGASLVLQAPDTVPGQNNGVRLKFASWQSEGLPSLVIAASKAPVNTIKVDAPYTLTANYDKQFQVVATNPGGTRKRDWVKEGDELLLETPPTIDIIPEQERFVFKGWTGIDGLYSPKISGQVLAPVNLTAVYERQAMLTVTAPYGATGGGWYKEGSTATVSVPGSTEHKLVFKRQFEGFSGQKSGEPTIQVVVKEPTTVTAMYSTGINVGMLLLVVSLPLLAVLVYLGGRRMRFRMPRRGR